MNMLFVFPLSALILITIFEIVNTAVFGIKFLKKSQTEALEKELETGEVIASGRIISCNDESDLKVWYIGKVIFSIFGNYYISLDGGDTDIRVFRFTKAHRLIKEKFNSKIYE